MILVEECQLRLDEPVDRLLPELTNRTVLTRLDAPLDKTVPASRPITVRDLLTFPRGLRHRDGAARHVSDPGGDEHTAARPGPAEAADTAGAR